MQLTGKNVSSILKSLVAAQIPADCNKAANKLRLVPCAFCFCSLVTSLHCNNFNHVLQMRISTRLLSRRLSDEDRLSRTGHYLDLRSFLLLSMVFSLSPLHFGQYHLPFGLYVSPTQEKWNHSIGHWSLSQPIISPYDTCSQRQ